jgi:hypothetical protein
MKIKDYYDLKIERYKDYMEISMLFLFLAFPIAIIIWIVQLFNYIILKIKYLNWKRKGVMEINYYTSIDHSSGSHND